VVINSAKHITGFGIRCCVGVWGSDDETNSSNYKEFENVVQMIEEEARSGLLKAVRYTYSLITEQ
jgi:hypothetical protein